MPSSLGIDLVIPAYNEAAALPSLYANLAGQVDGDGRPLPRGSWRLVLVDNASTDGTPDLAERLAQDPGHPETAVLLEPEKGVVRARAHGSGFVLRAAERRRFPFVVHGDADNLFPPTFLHDVSRHLRTGDADVVTRLGFQSVDFWRRVPQVARRQRQEIGTLHFDDQTLRELGISERGALFTRRIFADFGHVPHQCGLAMTKEAFGRVGGYERGSGRTAPRCWARRGTSSTASPATARGWPGWPSPPSCSTPAACWPSPGSSGPAAPTPRG